MARLTPRFSANRTVREYVEQHYLPAATAYNLRIVDHGPIGGQVAEWHHSLDQHWAALHFGEMKVEARGNQLVFDVQLNLAGLKPKSVRVEFYAEGVNGGAPVRQEMKCSRQLTDPEGAYAYSATVSAARPAADYTARVIPHCDDVAIPLED